jgi:Peptidase family M28
MPSPNRRRKPKIQIITKSALIRLAFLFLTLTILGLWGWSTMFQMPGQSYRASLPPFPENAIALKSALQQDLQTLSSPRNNVQYKKLNVVREFLAIALTKAGYQVKQQEYKINGKAYYNIEAEKLGTQKPTEIVVIGGHYDSAFTRPGANDNGSGAAATLELAKSFAHRYR